MSLHSVLTGSPPRPHPAHPYKVSESEKGQLVNETRWQYYGTSDTRGNLSLTWNTSTLSMPAVNIELWGYEETGVGPAKGLVEVLAWNFQTLRCEERSLGQGWKRKKGCKSRFVERQ